MSQIEENKTEPNKRNNGSQQDTHVDNLSPTFSRRDKAQLLLNSKRGRRKCGNAVLLMVDDESVFLGQKKLRDQERKKSHSLVPNRNRDKMASPDWEFPDV